MPVYLYWPIQPLAGTVSFPYMLSNLWILGLSLVLNYPSRENDQQQKQVKLFLDIFGAGVSGWARCLTCKKFKKLKVSIYSERSVSEHLLANDISSHWLKWTIRRWQPRSCSGVRTVLPRWLDPSNVDCVRRSEWNCNQGNNEGSIKCHSMFNAGYLLCSHLSILHINHSNPSHNYNFFLFIRLPPVYPPKSISKFNFAFPNNKVPTYSCRPSSTCQLAISCWPQFRDRR